MDKNPIKKLAFRLFLIFLIILPLIDHLNYKIYGKIGIDNIFLLFIVIASILSWRTISLKIRLNIPCAIFILLFFTAFFLPTFSSFLYGRYPNSQQLTMGLRFIQVILIIFLVNYFIRDWQDLKKITIAYLIGALIAALYGLGQALNIDVFWEIAERYYVYGKPHLYAFIGRRKVPSLFGETGNTFGAFMTMSLILTTGIGSFFLKRYQKYILLILFSIGLVTSLSITSILTLVVAFSLFALLSTRKLFVFKKQYIKNLIIFICLFLLVNTFYYRKVKYRFGARLKVDINNPLIVKGLSSRYDFWEEHLESFHDRNLIQAFLGVGYAESGIADNYYIELLGAGGMVSFAIFVFSLGALLLLNYKKYLLSRKNALKIQKKFHLTTFIMLASLSIMCLTASYLGYLVVSIPIAIMIVAASTRKVFNKEGYTNSNWSMTNSKSKI